MSFSHPLLLVLLAAPLLWAIWEWRRTERRAALVTKAAGFALILLALAGPRLGIWEQRLAVAVLADSSASISAQQIEREQRFLQDAAAARGRHQLRVISFDGAPRPGVPAAPRLESSGTNLEAALQGALASLPPAHVPRIVILSDGHANQGAIERALYQARESGTPVDAVVLEGRRRPELRLASVQAPARVFSGERFLMEIAVESPRPAQASVQLRAETATIGDSQVELEAGTNVVRVQARLRTAGAALIEGRILAEGLGELDFQHTLLIETPRVLLISSDPPETASHLPQVLTVAGFEVERSNSLPGQGLERDQLIIANNVDLERWSLPQKRRLEEYVRQGGSFLLIAGENNLYAEPSANAGDPLNEMLPANLAPPRTPEGTFVVLVLDKSSSMEGKKMQLARQSAIGVVENLRPIDQVGVLVFDNSFQWAVPPQVNAYPERTKQSIAGILADGGTQIAPALFEGYQKIRYSKAVYKHILLLTDGISEEGDSINLAREAAKQKITISAIGLGQDVNRSYLERVASTAEGRSYFLIDVEGLEQLVLQDVKEHTGSSVTERAVEVKMARPAEILDDLDLEQAGSLLGWVKFEAKPRAEVLLTVGDDPEDPLLTRWQYGLGRAAVFASDAKERWAVNWVRWPGFDRFWTNVARDLLPRSFLSEAAARYDASSDEVVLSYRLLEDETDARAPAPPQVYVFGPAELQRGALLKRVAGGRYEARVPSEGRYGLFRFRAASRVESFPEVAFYRANPELEEYGSNDTLLRKAAEFTGGRLNPAPGEIFDAGDRFVTRSMDLWPALLFLAVLLNLLELLGRKGWLPAVRGWR